MSNPTILIIDDEDQIRKILGITLQSRGFNVSVASTGQSGLTIVANQPPDLILLDLGLPDTSGHEVLKRLRDWFSNPIIIISVHDSEEEITKALNNGANDYLTKPFRTDELLERIKATLKKASREPNLPVLTFHDLTIDFANRMVEKGGHAIPVSPVEYSLLALLAKNEGKVLTHQYLMKELGRAAEMRESQYLQVLISGIRKKIEPDPNRPTYIITERGVGYRFRVPHVSHKTK